MTTNRFGKRTVDDVADLMRSSSAENTKKVNMFQIFLTVLLSDTTVVTSLTRVSQDVTLAYLNQC